jgi:hypothetical protein
MYELDWAMSASYLTEPSVWVYVGVTGRDCQFNGCEWSRCPQHGSTEGLYRTSLRSGQGELLLPALVPALVQLQTQTETPPFLGLQLPLTLQTSGLPSLHDWEPFPYCEDDRQRTEESLCLSQTGGSDLLPVED